VNILFIHQNFPGQFKHLAPALLRSGYDVRALVLKQASQPELKGIKQILYKPKRNSTTNIHPWVTDIETQTIRGEAVFHTALKMRQEGYRPDVIIAHPGWGESLFLKDVWPNAKLGIYCEYYYHATGSDVGFDDEFSMMKNTDVSRLRLKNINNMLHFSIADAGLSPTNWQAESFPDPFRRKISVIHEGIDTGKVMPNSGVKMNIKRGTGTITLSKSDEVITFVNRNLEPYRGYHIFMRTLPEILKRRPAARVLIVGGDGVSYGPRSKEGLSWKKIFINEVRPKIAEADWERVHFLGKIPYHYFIPLLQLSTVHLYLSYPFVLSWSLLEAMSAGAAIVSCNTAPVLEVIRQNETGRLVDFFDQKGIADEVCTLLDNRDMRLRLGANARAFAMAHYDLQSVCLPRQLAWVEKLASL